MIRCISGKLLVYYLVQLHFTNYVFILGINKGGLLS